MARGPLGRQVSDLWENLIWGENFLPDSSQDSPPHTYTEAYRDLP